MVVGFFWEHLDGNMVFFEMIYDFCNGVVSFSVIVFVD